MTVGLLKDDVHLVFSILCFHFHHFHPHTPSLYFALRLAAEATRLAVAGQTEPSQVFL